MQTRQKLQEENAQIRAQLLTKEALLASKDALLQAKDERLESQGVQLRNKETRMQSQGRLIDQLKEALILARNRQFAKTTESLRSLQSELFDEVEALLNEPRLEEDETDGDQNPIEVPAHQRKQGGRKALPEDIPRIEVIYDLDEQDKICAKGHDLVFMSDKVNEQLDIIPLQMRILRHIRKQYHCPCCAGVIKTAPKPKQPIEKSQASAGLLAYIAVGKYADSLPLYRQSQILKRFDIQMSRTTLANWMIQSGQLIQPLINRLQETLLNQPYLHMDETPVQVLNEQGKPAHSTSYMWVRCAGPPQNKVTLFDYDPSRSGAVPTQLLHDYQGALMVDGYEGYHALCQTEGITRLGCWVHARRKFVEVGKASKKSNPHAAYALKLIAKLYKVEKDHKEASPDARYQARRAQAKPIIDKLKIWLDDIQPKVAPKTALGKALYYLDRQWPRLVGYLDDGRYPIDNNPVENAIRPFTLGRKNWLFSASVNGAKASANLYSLIETAKANDIEPYGYLKRVFAEIPNAEHFDDIDQLLPWNNHP